MLIAHYYPSARDSYMARFENHVIKHKFLHNHCTKDVELIYCGSASQLVKAMAAKEAYKKPIICWVWDLPYCWREWCRTDGDVRTNAHRTKYVNATADLLRKCDKVISASKYTRRVLKTQFGIESEQIYFHIDTNEIDAIPALSQSGHVIQISRFVLCKRFDISIRAMKGLNRKLVCVGFSGKKYEALAKSLSVSVDFHYNVGRKTAIGLLKGAEVLVSPSVFEGWGITPIEALYCGVPVLLNDLEVFREVYGDAVPYHKRDDPDDMREKLRYLLSDKQLQKKIVKDCQPLISDFTAAKFASRWEKIIK